MKSPYHVPAGFKSTETVIKKSRFICWIAPVESREDALILVEKSKAEFPDARHHCWAYILGNPNSASAASYDDGEPSGTAGKPILNVLQHKNTGDVVAIVIRYFGGIKLGAGGLVRAYSSATQQSFEALKLIEKIPHETVIVECEYADEPNLRQWLSTHHGKIVASEYQQKVVLTLSLPSDDFPYLEKLLAGWHGAVINSEE